MQKFIYNKNLTDNEFDENKKDNHVQNNDHIHINTEKNKLIVEL